MRRSRTPSRRLAVVLCLLALALAVAGPARADSHDKAALVRELFERLDMRANLAKPIMEQGMKPLIAALDRQYPGRTELIEREVAGMMQRIMDPILDDVMQRSAELYEARLSRRELLDVLAFYDSPTGSKLLRLLPTFSAESGKWMAGYAGQIQQQFQAEVPGLIARLQGN